jgi:hypothetical protein
MSRRLLYLLVGSVGALLLAACPLRNLYSLHRCFADPQGIMDIPPWEMQLEVRLVMLQVGIALLGAPAVALGLARSRPVRVAGAAAWLLVAAGGVVWDKWLGDFQGPVLPRHSLYACLLDGRSEQTHSMLTNGPLLLSGALALWLMWSSRRATVTR